MPCGSYIRLEGSDVRASGFPLPIVFPCRLGHCALFVVVLQCCLTVGWSAFSILVAYGVTRAISATSAAGHGSNCRSWTACTVGCATGCICGAWWGVITAACLGLCPCWLLLWPARVTPEADASAVRRFQSECVSAGGLAGLSNLPGTDLQRKLHHYKATSFSQGQSWYTWFYKRRHKGRAEDPEYREGTSLIDAMERELCALGSPLQPPDKKGRGVHSGAAGGGDGGDGSPREATPGTSSPLRHKGGAQDPARREGPSLTDTMERKLRALGSPSRPPYKKRRVVYSGTSGGGDCGDGSRREATPGTSPPLGPAASTADPL